MFKYPEDTSFNAKIKTDATVDLLKKQVIEKEAGRPSQLLTIQEGDIHDDCFIYALTAGPDINPKPFTFPLNFHWNDNYYTVFDARASTRWDRVTMGGVVNNKPLFRRDVILTLMADTFREDPASIYSLGSLPVFVFANWISSLITRRFALDLAQSLELQILTAYYYICLFNDSGTNMDKDRIYPMIGRAVGTSVHYVVPIIKDVDYIPDIAAFIATIHSVIPDSRLEGLTPDIFTTLLSGTWFGPNHVQLVATALEHPATFCTLVYLALTDRANRATGLAQIAIRKEKDPIGREFIRLTSDLLSAEYPDFNS